MAYEFKRLSDVEVTAEPIESANVLIEENGTVKKTMMENIRGTSSWNDLTDKPFYEEEPTEKVVLEETEVSLDDGAGELPVMLNLTEGQTYNVLYNGTEYSCVAWGYSGLGAIGNGAIVGLTGGNNEPFLMAMNQIVAPQDTSAIIKITVIVTPIKKLDEKYLPDSAVLTKYQNYTTQLIDIRKVMDDFGISEAMDGFLSMRNIDSEVSMSIEQWDELRKILSTCNSDFGKYCGICDYHLVSIFDVNPNKFSIELTYIHPLVGGVNNCIIAGFDILLHYNQDTQILACKRTFSRLMPTT